MCGVLRRSSTSFGDACTLVTMHVQFCVCTCLTGHGVCVEVRGHLLGVGSPLTPCGVRGSSSGPRACIPVGLSTKLLYILEKKGECGYSPAGYTGSMGGLELEKQKV